MGTNLKLPPVYKRGQGVLEELGPFCQQLGTKVFIVAGRKSLAAVEDRVMNSLEAANLKITAVEWYGGECTWNNIDQLAEKAVNEAADLVVTLGGGKSLDTGKAVAYKSDLPCVTIPTIAATCAAFTPLSIIYDEEGVHLENSSLSACPEGVFVDVDVILQAPAKWLSAGMGDTLAKWYELRATTDKIPTTSWTLGGIDNGKICYKTIQEFGSGARDAIEARELNESFEYVIDSIIFYAGMSSILGGDKCRGAAAHSIFFGFTNLPEVKDLGHGFLVGFGNLCLLALEERSDQEILEEIKLAEKCGIPTKLSDIGSLSKTDLKTVAEAAAEAEDMDNMPFIVTSEMVLKAIKRIDNLSREKF